MEGNAILVIFPLLILMALIFFSFKCTLKWATFILLLVFSTFPLIVGLLLNFYLPHLSQEDVNFFPLKFIERILPFAVMLFMVGMAGYSLTFHKNTNPIPEIMPSSLRWFLFCLGVITTLLGLTFFVAAFFASATVRKFLPSPFIGVILFIVGISFGSIILYFSSYRNSPKNPNLMRWIIVFIIYLSVIYWPFLVASILIFAGQGHPRLAFPSESSLATLGYVPIALLSLMMARDSVNRQEA